MTIPRLIVVALALNRTYTTTTTTPPTSLTTTKPKQCAPQPFAKTIDNLYCSWVDILKPRVLTKEACQSKCCDDITCGAWQFCTPKWIPKDPHGANPDGFNGCHKWRGVRCHFALLNDGTNEIGTATGNNNYITNKSSSSSTAGGSAATATATTTALNDDLPCSKEWGKNWVGESKSKNTVTPGKHPHPRPHPPPPNANTRSYGFNMLLTATGVLLCLFIVMVASSRRSTMQSIRQRAAKMAAAVTRSAAPRRANVKVGTAAAGKAAAAGQYECDLNINDFNDVVRPVRSDRPGRPVRTSTSTINSNSNSNSNSLVNWVTGVGVHSGTILSGSPSGGSSGGSSGSSSAGDSSGGGSGRSSRVDYSSDSGSGSGGHSPPPNLIYFDPMLIDIVTSAGAGAGVGDGAGAGAYNSYESEFQARQRTNSYTSLDDISGPLLFDSLLGGGATMTGLGHSTDSIGAGAGAETDACGRLLGDAAVQDIQPTPLHMLLSAQVAGLKQSPSPSSSPFYLPINAGNQSLATMFVPIADELIVGGLPHPPSPPPLEVAGSAGGASASAGADEFGGPGHPSASEIKEAREYARSTATAAVQHAKLSMETDRLAVETQIAAKKEAAVTEAAVERRKATYVKEDKKTYYTAEVLGLAKRDRDVLIAKMMLTDLEKVELIQAVRRFKQLASQKRYLAKQKVKEMAKAAAIAAEIGVGGSSSGTATTTNATANTCSGGV